MLSNLISSFDTSWIGVIHQNTPTFMQGAADECMRNKLRFAMMRKKGRIKTGASGPLCIWQIQYKQPPVEPYGDGGGLEYRRHDLYVDSALNWRGAKSTDMMTELEYLETRGNTGRILNRWSQTIPTHVKAITDWFSGELIQDGEASGRTNRVHGLETFLGAGTTVANDLIAKPDDDYAGNATDLADKGGSWSTALGVGVYPNAAVATDWPNGTGSYEYDYNAPKLVNWSSTRWGTQSTTWEANCERSLRQTILWMVHTSGSGGAPEICTLSVDMFSGFQNHFSAKQRVLVPHKEAQDLGFENTLNFDGVAVGMDYDVPANTGYVENLKNMELMSLDDVLFGYRGPVYDARSNSWLINFGFWGNARYRPKHFGKLFNYA